MDGSFPITSIAFEAVPVRRALQLLKPAFPRRSCIPPRLDVTTHGVRSALLGRCADLEITVALESTSTPFSSSLPYHELVALLRPCGAEESVTISRASNSQIKIELPDISATIVVDAPEYGKLIKDHPERGATARIDAKPLLTALELVSGAMSTEETRYCLNGAFIQPHAEDATALNFVATDGHRLVKHTVTGIRHNFTSGIIMHKDAVNALRPLLAAYPDATLQFEMHGETRLNITAPGFELATKLIDGAFPDYNRVIPQASPLAAVMDSAALRRFLLRAKAISSGSGPGIRFTMRKGSDTIDISWQDGCTGKLAARLIGHAERDLKIGFQHRYLTHVLSVLKTPQIQLFADVPSSPTIFTGAAELADPHTTIVVMPMRV